MTGVRNSTRSVPPYLGRLVAHSCTAGRRASETLIAANQRDFIDLIVPCPQIANYQQRVAGILLTVDTQDRSWKFAHHRGATLLRRFSRDSLQEVGSGPVVAVGLQFPVGGITWRGEQPHFPPSGLGRAAFYIA